MFYVPIIVFEDLLNIIHLSVCVCLLQSVFLSIHIFETSNTTCIDCPSCSGFSVQQNVMTNIPVAGNIKVFEFSH